MSIKILAGKARGITLASPVSEVTRPTSVMLKRRIFDAHQDFQNEIFIDLCAGVGTIGLEAYSRGAGKVFLVEENFQIYKVLSQNAKLVESKIGEKALELIKADAIGWLEKNRNFLKENENSIILFFDPPYEKVDLYLAIFEKLKELDFNGQLWFEACRQKTMHEDEFFKKFYPGKVYRQGTSYIVVGALEKN